MLHGKIKWYNQNLGYGFITPQDGTGDVMLHAVILTHQVALSLKPGVEVLYTLFDKSECRSRANRCELLSAYELWELPSECSHRFALKYGSEVKVFKTVEEIAKFYNDKRGTNFSSDT